MGWRDRHYARSDYDRPGGQYGRLRLNLPRPTPVTGILMGTCAGLFLASLFTGARNSPLFPWLWLVGGKAHEVWRFLTFQFMHASASHFMWNLVGLYFFAPPLERTWGERRFLGFYLGSGVFGGLCFLGVLGAFFPGMWRVLPLVGASGGILACLAACAILFPEMIILIFPIRWVAAFLVLLYTLNVLWSRDLSDAAHLGGMVAGAGYVLALPWLRRKLPASRAPGAGRWEKRLRRSRREQERVDRILDKIRQRGLGSLSWGERRTLRRASRRREDHLP